MKDLKKIVVKVDGCAHHNGVITHKQLQDQGYFIPSDIQKVHITFNTK